jgi:hypothetical protein
MLLLELSFILPLYENWSKASIAFNLSINQFPIFWFARIGRKIHVNEIPEMQYNREYYQIPSSGEGKWRRFNFEVAFRWNILPKYFAC